MAFSDLVLKQHAFALLVSRLLSELASKDYVVAFGEAWRSPETAALYAKEGKGISNSLHIERLAVDLVLRKHGMLLDDTADFLEAGLLWESYSTADHKCAWGGRFGDGNHFSLEWGGRR